MGHPGGAGLAVSGVGHYVGMTTTPSKPTDDDDPFAGVPHTEGADPFDPAINFPVDPHEAEIVTEPAQNDEQTAHAHVVREGDGSPPNPHAHTPGPRDHERLIIDPLADSL